MFHCQNEEQLHQQNRNQEEAKAPIREPNWEKVASTREAEAEDCEFEVSLGYIMRLSQKTQPSKKQQQNPKPN
jgi:hypothetical protein